MLLFDSAIGHTITIKPKRYRALSSRSGIFPYILNDKLVWIFRPEDEVFSDESIESFLDCNITIGHPDDDMGVSESHGSVYHVESIKDNNDLEDGLYCNFLVFTDEANSLSSSGTPVSPMYDAIAHDEPGVHNGKNYDLIQKTIRYRSLGLVSEARQKTTKVFYQLSKDSNLILKNDNIIEVPVMKTNKSQPLTPPDSLLISDEQESENKVETKYTIENPEVSKDKTSDNQIENEEAKDPEELETSDDSKENQDSTIAEINTEGGVNVHKDYLDDAIDVSQRASDMGLLTFNEAMQYSLSSINTIKRMILLKEGIEIGEWDDVCASYRVYMKMKPLQNNQTNITVGDSKSVKSLTPEINHPTHVKSKNKGYETKTIVTFDDIE